MGIGERRIQLEEIFTNFFSSTTQPSTRRGVLLVGALLLFNVFTAIAALVIGIRYPILLGFALLAWGFGLRHAMDADHIAAIDNATRRLLYRGKPSVGVGVFFALGHSTIVFLLSFLIAFFVSSGAENIGVWKHIGQTVGAVVSSLFLLLIGVLNTVVLYRLTVVWKKVGSGEENSYHGHMHIGGPIEKIFRPLIKLVDKSYKMYFVGFLFGLGFDTATEIGLLALSALAAENIPPLAVMILPLAFLAGMALLDTANGLLMLGIYSWGALTEKDRLMYNINVTALSAFSALAIGGTIGLQFLSRRFEMDGGIFALANQVSLSGLGYVLVGLFILSWVVTYISFRERTSVEEFIETPTFP
jgi:high-affinity nickel-transport protein